MSLECTFQSMSTDVRTAEAQSDPYCLVYRPSEMGREEVLGCLQRLMMLPPGYEILQGASIHIARYQLLFELRTQFFHDSLGG
jgi:hypothetical protein